MYQNHGLWLAILMRRCSNLSTFRPLKEMKSKWGTLGTLSLFATSMIWVILECHGRIIISREVSEM